MPRKHKRRARPPKETPVAQATQRARVTTAAGVPGRWARLRRSVEWSAILGIIGGVIGLWWWDTYKRPRVAIEYGIYTRYALSDSQRSDSTYVAVVELWDMLNACRLSTTRWTVSAGGEPTDSLGVVNVLVRLANTGRSDALNMVVAVPASIDSEPEIVATPNVRATRSENSEGGVNAEIETPRSRCPSGHQILVDDAVL